MAKSPSTTSLAAMGAMLALLYANPAHALSKVWVANTGTDSDSCGAVTSPCRTFVHALMNVAAGGEIGVLTPGDYAPVGIGKSISIINDSGGEASLLHTDGTCQSSGLVHMFIDAFPGDVISLRGLVFEGCVFGSVGIDFVTGSALHIQNVVIKNFEGYADIGFEKAANGLWFHPFNGQNLQLFVSDSIIFNNGSPANTGGIVVQPLGSGSARLVLDRVHLENNVVGLLVDGTQATGNGAHVVIRDSVVSGNASDGIRALSAPGMAPAFVAVEHTTSVNNAGTGIVANGPGATVLLNDNTITRNGTGISAINSGQLISYGNNKNNNNIGPEGAPTGLYSQM